MAWRLSIKASRTHFPSSASTWFYQRAGTLNLTAYEISIRNVCYPISTAFNKFTVIKLQRFPTFFPIPFVQQCFMLNSISTTNSPVTHGLHCTVYWTDTNENIFIVVIDAYLYFPNRFYIPRSEYVYHISGVWSDHSSVSFCQLNVPSALHVFSDHRLHAAYFKP